MEIAFFKTYPKISSDNTLQPSVFITADHCFRPMRRLPLAEKTTALTCRLVDFLALSFFDLPVDFEARSGRSQQRQSKNRGARTSP
jgi:hypothetical protein